MKEYVFLSELQKLHDFISEMQGESFIIDDCEFVLMEIIGEPPKSRFLFERADHEYRIVLTVFEVYERAIKGNALPKKERKKESLKKILLEYPYIRKSQIRRIEKW